MTIRARSHSEIEDEWLQMKCDLRNAAEKEYNDRNQATEPGYVFSFGSTSGFGKFKGFRNVDDLLSAVRKLLVECDGIGELTVKKERDPE